MSSRPSRNGPSVASNARRSSSDPQNNSMYLIGTSGLEHRAYRPLPQGRTGVSRPRPPSADGEGNKASTSPVRASSRRSAKRSRAATERIATTPPAPAATPSGASTKAPSAIALGEEAERHQRAGDGADEEGGARGALAHRLRSSALEGEVLGRERGQELPAIRH